jgi:membrane-bound ClpP family serine protease
MTGPWGSMFADAVLAVVFVMVLFELVEHGFVPLVWHLTRREKKPAVGFESMIGEEVEVKTWREGEGVVVFKGELWTAESQDYLGPGSRAVIERTDGLRLRVTRGKDEKA